MSIDLSRCLIARTINANQTLPVRIEEKADNQWVDSGGGAHNYSVKKKRIKKELVGWIKFHLLS